MKFKKLYLILLIIIVSFTFGCNQDNVNKPESNENQQGRQIVDSIGRTITVPSEIHSISALYTVTGHIIIMLDEGDSITSCSKGLKRDKLILNMEPHINDIYMPKSSGMINIEELLKSEPDLIFIDTPTYWNKGEIKKIEDLNIPYFVIEFNSIDDEKYVVQTIGEILGQTEEAARYIEFYDRMIGLSEKISSRIPEDEKWRVYHSINEAVRTSAPNTLPAEWLKKAGCINVALDGDLKQDEDKFFTTIEDILLWNPEVILTNEPATYDYIHSMDAWENIDAVLNDRVYLLPTGISRWGHATSLETPLALIWTMKTLYPTYTEDIDVKALMKEFYHELFEYELSDEEINQVLSGLDMRRAKNLED